ncbi:TRIC cation channel family protein [Clostridium sp. 19966]|uniref:trimeric intracellular cation channel family protein n=1 Tax=Clostridium sp. 19966 TaxID=2768166 RepID=UPI0028DE8A2E|nr:TRIC cation channel family protein [Clostridium sp. 19966]MDT8717775.1 TRIC cation channel family protein [Clostridium sp. 19966]
MSLFVFALEIIGTIAFAVSGAMTGIKKNMDILGVIILGMTTAIGGGVIRDLILGVRPPKTFLDPSYALISIFSSIITFAVIYYGRERASKEESIFYERILFIFDTIGLGIFTVVGMDVAFSTINNCGIFISVFVGVVTGVGGGILRDMMAGNTPYVFVKHVYASACIVGGIICAFTWHTAGKTFSMILGMALVIIIRILAAYYKWNLPKIAKTE